ncbi:MAG: hypothetical protein R2824_13915 [Saprospiraceae bacterium]|nr:hypothetical protein [Lewinella sp.]
MNLLKPTIHLIALLVIGFLLQSFLPWWIVVLAAGGLAWGLQLTPRQAFVASLLAGMLLWGGYAIYLDNGILSHRLGQMMGGLSSFWIFLLTALIGGLLAAMGGVTGSLGRNLRPATKA